jgi:ATP phosphoribosyltransferase
MSETIVQITPSQHTATVSPIEDDGWCAVSAMVERKSAVVLDELVAASADNFLLVALHICKV